LHYARIRLVCLVGAFFVRIRQPPTSTLFPYTTLFRSWRRSVRRRRAEARERNDRGASYVDVDRRRTMSGEHERQATFVLARLERRVLIWLAARLPAGMMPDHLTLIGMLGATMVGAGDRLSNRDEDWLLLANGGLVGERCGG